MLKSVQEYIDYASERAKIERILDDADRKKFSELDIQINKEIYGDIGNESDNVVDVTDILARNVYKRILEKDITPSQRIAIQEQLNMLGQEEEKADPSEIERMANYEIAKNESIVKMLFLFGYLTDSKKIDLIDACFHYHDQDRIQQIKNLMHQLEERSDYDESNSWGDENWRIISGIIHKSIDCQGKESEPGYIEFACGIAEEFMNRLSQRNQLRLRQELLDIRSDSGEEDAYIEQLISDAELYCMKKKPRGKGGAQNTNRMSEEFIHCYKKLENMNRLDIVVRIMNIFRNADDIKPIPYRRWISFMKMGLSDSAFRKVKNMAPELFE